MEKQDNSVMTKAGMQNFAQSVAQECKKFYAPTLRHDNKKSDAAINIACLRAIKYRQQYCFGMFGVIKIVKLIRKELKKMDYQAAFTNELTISLVLALMRMNIASATPR